MSTDIQVDILECEKCPKLDVVVNEIRLTSHKCTGTCKVMSSQPGSPSLQHIELWLGTATQSKPSKIEIIECGDCSRLGVSIDDIRLTSHKCSGKWETHSAVKAVMPVATLQLWKKAAERKERQWMRENAARRRNIAARKQQFMVAFVAPTAAQICAAITRLVPKTERHQVAQFYATNALTKSGMAEIWARSRDYTTPYPVKHVTLAAISKSLAVIADREAKAKAGVKPV